MNLGEFIDTFKEAIARRVVESFPPLYRPSENGDKLPRLLRKPLGAQADAIRGAALSLEAHRGTTVVGEMGTGKTFIAAAAAHMAGFRRILVLCPPHLVPKWKREVEMTVPGARAVIVKSITDLERLRLSVGSGPLFAVMSREKAKLSYRWMPAVIQRWAVSRGRLLRDEETGEPFRVPCCPDCTAQIVDKDGVPLTDADLNRRKHTCAGCGSPLWQADKSGPARYPLADYVKHRMKGFFDLLVGDEVHEYKGRGSAQGIAAGVLADVCGKSLSLSGTLMGGYSSTLFHLLYRFSPELRTDFERSDEHRWTTSPPRHRERVVPQGLVAEGHLLAEAQLEGERGAPVVGRRHAVGTGRQRIGLLLALFRLGGGRVVRDHPPAEGLRRVARRILQLIRRLVRGHGVVHRHRVPRLHPCVQDQRYGHSRH